MAPAEPLVSEGETESWAPGQKKKQKTKLGLKSEDAMVLAKLEMLCSEFSSAPPLNDNAIIN